MNLVTSCLVCVNTMDSLASLQSCFGEKITASPERVRFQTLAELFQKINSSDDILQNINNAFVICQKVFTEFGCLTNENKTTPPSYTRCKKKLTEALHPSFFKCSLT